MNEREKFLMRMAVLYMISNLDDVNDAFEHGPPPEDNDRVSVNGEIGIKPEEDELNELMMTLQ